MLYHIEENFLPSEVFEAVKQRAPLFRKYARMEDDAVATNFDIDIEQGYYEKNLRRNRVWRANYKTYIDKVDVSETMLNYFGDEFRFPLEKVKKVFIDKGLSKITLKNMWLQYADKQSAIHRHIDGAIFSAPIQTSFTALLWCHEYWDTKWGGELKMILDGKTTTFNPKPNTFVAWTRDTVHWVTPINEEYDENIHPTRTMLGYSLYQY
jgi:hypothetical protein